MLSHVQTSRLLQQNLRSERIRRRARSEPSRPVDLHRPLFVPERFWLSYRTAAVRRSDHAIATNRQFHAVWRPKYSAVHNERFWKQKFTLIWKLCADAINPRPPAADARSWRV